MVVFASIFGFFKCDDTHVPVLKWFFILLLDLVNSLITSNKDTN